MKSKYAILFFVFCFLMGCTSPEKTIPTRPASSPDNVNPQQTPPEYKDPAGEPTDTLPPEQS